MAKQAAGGSKGRAKTGMQTVTMFIEGSWFKEIVVKRSPRNDVRDR